MGPFYGILMFLTLSIDEINLLKGLRKELFWKPPLKSHMLFLSYNFTHTKHTYVWGDRQANTCHGILK